MSRGSFIMASVQKLCCVCGKDVASSKRVKDPRGRYYCEPCAKARQPAAAASAHVPAHAAAPTAAAPELELDLAPVREHAPEVKAACSRCKKLLPERLVRMVEGEFICNACMSQKQQTKGGAKPAKSKGKVEEDEVVDTGEPGFLDTVAGGLLVSVAMLALAFFIFFGLYKMLPDRDISGTFACLVA